MTIHGPRSQESKHRPESLDWPTAAELVRSIVGDYAEAPSGGNCEANLEKSVTTALDHARDMVHQLGSPLVLDPRDRTRSPLASFLFASREEMLDVLRHASRVRQVFMENAERCVFLLTMHRREYEVLGTELEHGVIRSGVLQHAVEFLGHSVPLAAPNPQELEHVIAREIVLYLAAIAPARVHENRSAKEEIIRSEELLKAQIHTLEQAQREHRPFAVPDALRGKLKEGQRELSAIEEKLRALPLTHGTVRCLEEIRQILDEPGLHIRLERMAMRVDDFGITTDKGEPVVFHECVYDDGRRMAVAIAETGREAALQLWPDMAGARD